MIAQNDALDEIEKFGYQKFFRSTKNSLFRLKMAIFGLKMAIFGPKLQAKMAILFQPKNVHKKFFFVFSLVRPDL